jgi:hypothetical protein
MLSKARQPLQSGIFVHSLTHCSDIRLTRTLPDAVSDARCNQITIASPS